MNIPKEAFNADDLIINQGLLNTVPFGNYKSDYNGCSWIAIYNLLRLFGFLVKPSEIREHVQKFLRFGGKFGMLPWRVKRVLEDLRIRVKLIYPTVKTLPETGILFYLHWSKGCLFPRAHYVAFAKNIVYNLTYGVDPDHKTPEELLRARPFRICIMGD